MKHAISKFEASFGYNKKGYGYTIITDGENVTASIYCRTGRLDSNGKLLDAIPTGVWTGRESPVLTTESAMIVDGYGWKYRLWTPDGEWSHYLFHPDGNKPGSMGCIVPVKYHSLWMFYLFTMIHQVQDVLQVEVTKE